MTILQDDINAEMRARLTGKSNTPPFPWYGQSPANKSAGIRVPAEGDLVPTSTIFTSPLDIYALFSLGARS